MNRFWRFSVFPVFILLITSCGGGGGSTAPADTLASLPYTGLTSPAFFNSSDVEEFMLSAYYDNSYISVLTTSASIPQQATVQASIKAAAESITDPGMCGGFANYALDVNRNTGDFNGKVVFDGFNDCEAAMTGTVQLSGQINLVSLQFNSMDMKFDRLSFIDKTLGDLLLSGHFSISQQGITDTINFNLRVREDSSGKVYWYDNYKVKLVHGYDSQSYEDETISGRFYDPDRGYIDVSTASQVRTYYGDDWSSSGVIMATGANNATVRLTFISAVLYRVEMDVDGDKVYEYDTGRMHYPDANTLPVVDAGPDTVGNVRCGISLDGSSSEDADFDALQYTWAIAVAPLGSTSQLTNPSSATPSFLPDVKGEYQFSLSVTDGFDTVTNTVKLTTYGDLFCINDSTVIPYAQTGQYEAGLAVGDVTADGKADVLALNREAALYIFTQNQSGELNPPVLQTVENWRAVMVGDVTGDGRNDAVVTTDTGVGVLKQNDSGGLAAMVRYIFEPPLVSSAYSYSLALGDFDSDSRLDVAVLPEGGPVYVFLQQSDGTLGTSSIYETSITGWGQVLAGDVTGDGRTDIVLSRVDSYRDNNVGVLPQDPSGGFAATVYYSIGNLPYTFTNRLVLGDLNGDSKLDLAYDLFGFDGNSAQIEVRSQSASGTFEAPVVYDAYYPPIYDMAVADVTGDGLSDLVVMHGTPDTSLPFSPTTVAVFAATGAGTLAPYDRYPLSQVPQSWGGLAVGDVGGDGKNDVVLTAQGCDEIFNCQPNLVLLHGVK